MGRNILFRAFCALADGAVSPIASTLEFFREEYEAHVREHRCPVKGGRPGALPLAPAEAAPPGAPLPLSEVLP